MAANEEKKKVSRIKIKKKVWYKIVAPKNLGQNELGETYLTSPESAIGRVLKINLREMTGNVKDQNVYVKFQINKVSGTTLNTAILGLELTSAYVKRAVRKGTNRLDDYFVLKTKSGKEVIVKILLVTLNKIQRSVCTELKRQFKEILSEELSKSDFETFVINLVNNRIYAQARKRLAKVYPVKELAIRILELNEKGLVTEEIIVEEKVKEAAPVVDEKSKNETEEKKTISTEEEIGEAAEEETAEEKVPAE